MNDDESEINESRGEHYDNQEDQIAMEIGTNKMLKHKNGKEIKTVPNGTMDS